MVGHNSWPTILLPQIHITCISWSSQRSTTSSCSTTANLQSTKWPMPSTSRQIHKQHSCNTSTQCWHMHRCSRIFNSMWFNRTSLTKSNKPTPCGRDSHIGSGTIFPAPKTLTPTSRCSTIKDASMSMIPNTQRSLNMMMYISWSRWPFARSTSPGFCSCLSKPNAHKCETQREASQHVHIVAIIMTDCPNLESQELPYTYITTFMEDWALGNNCRSDTTSETISGERYFEVSRDSSRHPWSLIFNMSIKNHDMHVMGHRYMHEYRVHNTPPPPFSNIRPFRKSHGIQGHTWLATSQQHGRSCHQSGRDGDRWYGLFRSHGHHNIPRTWSWQSIHQTDLGEPSRPRHLGHTCTRNCHK